MALQLSKVIEEGIDLIHLPSEGFREVPVGAGLLEWQA